MLPYLARRPAALFSRRAPRCLCVALVLCAAVDVAASRSVAYGANARLISLGAGLTNTVQGQIGAGPISGEHFVGTFRISIDGGPLTDAYCVDLSHSIRVNDVVPQIPPDYACEVVFILTHTFPTANNIPGALADNREAAAVQSAIWKFTDDFNVTAPPDVVARAGAIITAAENQCMSVPAVPQTIVMTPLTATNYIDPLQGGGDTTHGVTATLLDTADQPIPNHPIKIVITGTAGPQTFNGTTDVAGEFMITYSNTFVVTGSDTLTASASFSVPVGLEFKSLDKQGIVLAGNSRTGTVTGTATKNWVAARCGDGVVNELGEECDDGNSVEGDGCDSNCSQSRCGNGIQAPGEECDDGNTTNGDGCDANCKPTGCGNGIQTAGEECDDGNLVDGDGCDSNCTLPRCGNEIVDAGEECDDGNTTSGDGCDANCKPTACGNGIRTGDEQCDDGNLVNGDGCDANCTLPGCGNGIVDGDEECDDNNLVSGDGCDANCKPTGCGNGIQTAGEECDDGNTVDGDGCNADCTLPLCGNGVIDPGEQCDDGNTLDGDGCSSICRIPEDCADLIDNDGDNLIDCEDPDCGTCDTFYKDPALIKFPFNQQNPDRLYFGGGVIPNTPVDPLNEQFGVLLTNANGVIYRAFLLPGDLVSSGPTFSFRDPAARHGLGARDGLYKVKGFLREKIWHIKVFAYGELSSATLPTMAIQVLIGDDVFMSKGDWIRTTHGWKFEFQRPPRRWDR